MCKARKSLRYLLFPLLWFPTLLMGQTGNTFYAARFPGSTQGQMIANAQAQCTNNLTCVIVIDPIVAAYPVGTVPAQCANCIWQDYRTPAGAPGSNNGFATAGSYANIPAAVAACGSTCAVIAPPAYTTSDTPAWSLFNATGTGIGPQSSTLAPSGLTFWDERFGFYRTYVPQPGPYASLLGEVAEQAKVNFTNGPVSLGQRFQSYIAQLVPVMHTWGGMNSNYPGLVGKTTLIGHTVWSIDNSVGQRYAYQARPFCLAPGDCLGMALWVSGAAGARDPGDEGTEAISFTSSESINVFRGTLAASPNAPATGATVLTVTPATAGAGEVIDGTQGEGRPFYDTNSGDVCAMTATAVTDNVQQIGSTYGYFSTITGSPCLSVSSASATLTSAITVATGNSVPGLTSFAFTANTGTIAPGLACVADQTAQSGTIGGQGNFETVSVQTVTGGTGTAGFMFPHPAGALIFEGGNCGQFAEIAQDTFGASTAWTNGETGGTTVDSVKHVWPVLGSLDGTHAIVWTARSQGGGFFSHFSASAGSQTVNLYNGAMTVLVKGVYNDTTDHVFTLMPNSVAWAPGMAVEEGHYPAQLVNGITGSVSSFGAAHGYGTHLAMLSYRQGAERNDVGWVGNNAEASTDYVPWGGLILPPSAAFQALGTWRSALQVNGPVQWAVELPCGSAVTPCGTLQRIVNPGYTQTSDYFGYTNTNSNGSGGTWTVAGNLSVTGTLNGLTVATPNVLAETATSCRITGPVTNTGSTSLSAVLYSCQIPAGALTSSGRVDWDLNLDVCTASGVPFAGCTGANTGTCTLVGYLATSATGTTTQVVNFGLQAAKGGLYRVGIQNQGSLSSQWFDSTILTYSNTVGPAASSPGAATINTGNAFYLNFKLQNSVSGDVCGVTQTKVVTEQ